MIINVNVTDGPPIDPYVFTRWLEYIVNTQDFSPFENSYILASVVPDEEG